MKKQLRYVSGKKLLLATFSVALMIPSGNVSHRTLASLQKDLSGAKPVSTERVLTDMGKAIAQIARMDIAVAGSPATVNVTNLFRGSYGMVMGYSDHDAYVSLVCGGVDPGVGGQCDGPPEVGIAGAVADVLNGLSSIANSAGINSCDDVPVPAAGTSSSAFNGTDALGNSWTFVFQAPTHSIPSPWLNGGVPFQKRALITVPHAVVPAADSDFTVAFEFNCHDLDTAKYVDINMPMSNASGYTRYITIFDGTISNTDASNPTKGVETYLAEYNSTTGRIRGATAIRIEHDNSIFHLDGVLGNGGIETPDHSHGIGFIGRVVATGDLSTHQTSIMMDGIAKDSLSGDPDGALDVAAIESGFAAQVAATGVTNGTGATPTFSLGSDLTSGGASVPTDSTELYYRGCVDLTSPDTSPGSNATCSGLNLIAPSTGTYIGSGSLSIQWTLDHVGPDQEAL